MTGRVLLLVLLGWCAALSAPALASHTLTFGVLASRADDMNPQRWMPLADYMSRNLAGVDIELRMLDEEGLTRALRRNEVDLLLVSPAHQVSLRQSFPLSGVLATVVSTRNDQRTSAMGGTVVVPADSPARQLKDLVGMRAATLGPTHLGGYLSIAGEFERLGIDLARRVRLREIDTTHEDVIAAMLGGSADAAFVRTGIVEAMIARGDFAPQQVRVLNEQNLPGFPFVSSTRLYPEWAVIALPHVEPRMAGQIAAALLSLGVDDDIARAAGIGGFTLPADYLPVEELMRSLRIAPFDHVPPPRFTDIWERYGYALAALFLLAAAMASAIPVLLWNRGRLMASREALAESEERLDLVVTGTEVGFWDWNVSTGACVFNDRWARMLGFELAELEPLDIHVWERLLHPADREGAEEQLRRHFSGETELYACELRMRHRDGHWVWVEARGKVSLWSADRRPLRMVGTHTDISERKRAEQNVRLAASVFSTIPEGVMITDAEHRIVDVNAAFEALTSYPRTTVLGCTPAELRDAKGQGLLSSEASRSLRDEGAWRGEVWHRRRDGELAPVQVSITTVRNERGQVTHHVLLFSDISHLKAHERELEQIANYDSLTGLPNRRLLADRLFQAMARARREGCLMALAVLDLDGFKPINDSLGHEAGDRVLQIIAARLRDNLRGGDTAARLGGDEFVLVLQDLDDIAACREGLQRVLATVAEPLEIDSEGRMRVSASLGATLFPFDDADADTLLRHADQAMYVAKQEGKNRFHLFDAEHDREVQSLRAGLERMAQALADGEFVLHYQPKVDMLDGRLLGVEALLRWQHPERGLLAPGEFLHLMSNTPQEGALGEWVVDAALKQVQRWQAQGLDVPVAVNMSIRHIVSPDFIPRLEAVLRAHPAISPDRLEFEILESAAVEDWDEAARVLGALRRIGIEAALDDFGTGYSSLIQLRRLSARTLKIDQHFVRDMLDDPDDFTIVESVVRLSESFGRALVAEGVETEAHARALLRLGCRVGQGYGIARPMPPDVLPDWLARWRTSGFWRLSETGRPT